MTWSINLLCPQKMHSQSQIRLFVLKINIINRLQSVLGPADQGLIISIMLLFILEICYNINMLSPDQYKKAQDVYSSHQFPWKNNPFVVFSTLQNTAKNSTFFKSWKLSEISISWTIIFCDISTELYYIHLSSSCLP